MFHMSLYHDQQGCVISIATVDAAQESFPFDDTRVFTDNEFYIRRNITLCIY